MNTRRRVILYGSSVILGTVGASLARYPDLDVVALSPPLPDLEGLEALAPDVILFDIDIGPPDAPFALLRNCANLLLAGVNPENEQVRVWSSAQGEVVTADDLLQLLGRARLPQEGDPL